MGAASSGIFGREVCPALLKTAFPDGYCPKPGCQQAMGNVRGTSQHHREGGVTLENPWTAPSSGQLIPEIPQELGNPCLGHHWGATTPSLLLLEQHRQHFFCKIILISVSAIGRLDWGLSSVKSTEILQGYLGIK